MILTVVKVDLVQLEYNMNLVEYDLSKEKWVVQSGGERLFIDTSIRFGDGLEEGEKDYLDNDDRTTINYCPKSLPTLGKSLREAAKVLKRTRKNLELIKSKPVANIPPCDDNLYLMGEVFGFLLSGAKTAKEYFENYD